MASTKISSLPDGSPIVQSTDYIPIVRGGANYKGLLSILGSTLMVSDPTGSGTNNVVLNTALDNMYLTVIPIAKGGTGQTTANASFNALVPDQVGNTDKLLVTDGSNTFWADSIKLSSLTLEGSAPQILTSGTGNLSINTTLDTVSVVPSTTGGSTWINGIGSDGLPTFLQPAFTNLTGTITNAQMSDNTIAYSRLANISSNNILGRSGSSGPVVAMSISTVRSMLGYPTSSVVNNIVTFSTTGGGMQDSGISKNIVATIDTDTTPQAGQFSVFETTGFNTLVTSGFGLSSIGNKFMVLSLTTTQSAGISTGNPVIFNTIASNTTDTVSYDTSTGIIGLGQNRSYRFTYIPYIRFNNSSGFVELLLTVNGNSTVMSNSVTGYFRPLTSAAHETPSNIIFGQLTTGGSGLNTVRVTMNAPTEVQDFYGGGDGPVNLMFIEEYPL